MRASKRLEDGDLTLFDAVVDNARSADQIEQLAEWSVEFLALNDPESVSARRRQELEALETQGICAGGIHGLTDPKLHSVYGQIVLRVVMSLEQAPGAGWPLLRAALQSETTFHRECAAKALARWPRSSVSPAIVNALIAASGASSDSNAIAAIDAVMAQQEQ